VNECVRVCMYVCVYVFVFVCVCAGVFARACTRTPVSLQCGACVWQKEREGRGGGRW